MDSNARSEVANRNSRQEVSTRAPDKNRDDDCCHRTEKQVLDCDGNAGGSKKDHHTDECDQLPTRIALFSKRDAGDQVQTYYQIQRCDDSTECHK